MPACLDCGNQVAFIHQIVGMETRLYDENGDYDGSEHQQFETTACWCDECKSQNVEFN